MDSKINDPFEQANPARTRQPAEPPVSLQAPGRQSAAEMTKRKTKRHLELWLIVPMFVAIAALSFWPAKHPGPVVPKVDQSISTANNGPQIVDAARNAAASSEAKDREAAAKAKIAAQASPKPTAVDPNAPANAILGVSGAPSPAHPTLAAGNVASQGMSLADERAAAKKKAEREAQIAAAPLLADNVALLGGQQGASAGAGGGRPSQELVRLQLMKEALAQEDPNAAADKAAKLAALYRAQGASAPGPTSKAGQQDQWFTSHKSNNADVVSMHTGAPGFVITQGTPIRAVQLNGLNTDSPGTIVAQVTSNVYDSRTGSVVLIPQGSRVIGEYDHNIQYGQDRILIALTRLIRPDGSWIDLSGAAGDEMNGQAGLEGDVNNHFLKIFGSALVVGAATLLLDKSQQQVTVNQGLGTTQLGGSIFAQTLQQVVSNLLDRNKDIAPTITRGAGTEFIFMVTHDMSLTPYQRS